MPFIFLLSPANCNGLRAKQLLSERASFPLAARLRSAAGAPLGDVFSFVSGLYFRGKLAYARRFAAPCDSGDGLESGVLVITPGAGLRSADTPITHDAIRRFASISVEVGNAAYRTPLVESARRLKELIEPDVGVVLLGSIATPKYVDLLLEVFGDRLLFPREFVGRGDMSRGGLLLRQVEAGRQLDYVPVAGAIRHGARPPKLPQIHRLRPRT
jgi:hypothetical protein